MLNSVNGLLEYLCIENSQKPGFQLGFTNTYKVVKKHPNTHSFEYGTVNMGAQGCRLPVRPSRILPTRLSAVKF